MKYAFNSLPDNLFQPLNRYLNMVFTDDARDNWLDSQFVQTIPEWLETFEKLGDSICSPFIKDELEENYDHD